MSSQKLIEGIDFTLEEYDGIVFKVFTSHYLIKRGFCCNNKCRNCPYTKNDKNDKKNK